MVTKEELKEYSENLMFRMNDEEYDTLLKEFDIFLGWMDYINKIDGLSEVEPLYFPYDIGNVSLREDEPIDSLDSNIALSNAKKVNDGSVIVPRVIE